MKPVVSRTVFWYLARRIALPVLMALAAFTLVDLLGEGSDRFAGWLRAGVEFDGFGYLALRVPFMVSQLLPVSILGGVMFAFAMLHRTEEVVALQAVGISRSQLALPVFAFAAVLTIFDFGLCEHVVPVTNRWARQLLENELRRERHQAPELDKIWVRTRDGFLMAERFDKKRGELKDVTVYRMGPYPKLHAIEQVSRADWMGTGWCSAARTASISGTAIGLSPARSRSRSRLGRPTSMLSSLPTPMNSAWASSTASFAN
jgi:lipopolysaccharide export LptBFGC system permease protein LptF